MGKLETRKYGDAVNSVGTGDVGFEQVVGGAPVGIMNNGDHQH